MQVLVTDQFLVTPYWLQQHPTPFTNLVADVMATADRSYPKPRVEEVTSPETYRPNWGTSVFRADAQGMAELWLANWDSA